MTTLDRAASRRRAIAAVQVIAMAGVWGLCLHPAIASVRSAAVWSAVAASITTAWLMRRTRAHRIIRSSTEDINDVVVTALAGAAAAMVGAASTGEPLPVPAVLLASAASIMILLIVRSLAARSRSMQRHARRVVVIGTGEEGAELAQLVIEHPEAAMKLVGVVGNRTMADRNGLGPALLGDVDRLASILSSASIDMAIVTPTGFRAPQYRRIMAAIEDARVDAYLSSGVGRIAAPRYQVSSLVHEPFLSIGWDEPSALQQLARRAIDIAGAGVGLLLASPVMLVAALAVKLYDRGPVLYRSGRIGQDRQPFGMLKFRSMRPDADQLKNDLAQRNERSGPLFKVSNDPRVTPVGRLLRETSIDELPQLINVLRGDMSLVGPRPALPEEHERFDDELMARFGVRPGITGLWQVEARSNAEFGAYRRLDLHYVANRSLLLDAQIIVATVVQILTSVLLLPVSLIARRQFVDQISDHAVAPVIDLRAAGESINELPPPTSVSAGN